MKFLKRSLSFALAVLMVIALLPGAVFARATEQDVELRDAKPYVWLGESYYPTRVIGNRDIAAVDFFEWGLGEPESVGLVSADTDPADYGSEWHYLEHDLENTEWADDFALVVGMDLSACDPLITPGEYYFIAWSGDALVRSRESVTVIEGSYGDKPILEYIYISNMPNKTFYHPGEALDLTGLEVTAFYFNADPVVITGYTVDTQTAPAQPGIHTVWLTYVENGVEYYDRFVITVLSANRLAVIFLANGGTPASTTVLVDVGFRILNPPVVTREGFVFRGWYTTEDFSGEPISSGYYQFYENTTLYAKWLPKVTVTFAANGGTPEPAQQELGAGESAAAPFHISKEGYTYGGWYETPDFSGSQYVFSTPVTQDITLYAKWNDPALTGVTITQPPNKVNYRVGEALDLSGMVVTAYYSAGPSKIVTGYTSSPADGAILTATGRQSLTVSYTEGGVTQRSSVAINVDGLSSIRVSRQPDRTAFYPGEAPDYTGLEVTALYTDGTSKAVTGYTLSTPGTSGGAKTVTATYTEDGITKTVNFTISIATLQSISLSGLPERTVYYPGEMPDFSGVVVTGHYNYDLASRVLANYGRSTPSTAPGSKTVTFSATENATIRTASFSFTVASLRSIQISALPDKVIYLPGEALDTAGLEVMGVYSGGLAERVASGWTTTPANGGSFPAGLGQKTVTVSFSEGGSTRTASFQVTVANLTGVKVSALPAKTVYEQGEALDLGGLVVSAVYTGGLEQVITGYAADPAAGAVLDTAGSVSVTVSFGGFEDSFSVTVNETEPPVVLEGISIASLPAKTSYFIAQGLDLTGLTVTASYSDGETRPVTGYTTDPAEGALLSPADDSVTVSYTEDGVTKTANFPIQVRMPQITEITLMSLPDKRGYLTGEALDLTGLQVWVSYESGAASPVTDFTTVPAAGAALNQAGGALVLVRWTDSTGTVWTTSFAITVSEPVYPALPVLPATIVQGHLSYIHIPYGPELDGADFALLDGSGAVIGQSVRGVDGRAVLSVTAPQEPGAYDIVATVDGAIKAKGSVEVTAYNPDIWNVTFSADRDGFVVLHFNEAVTPKDGRFDSEVALDGKTVSCALGNDGRSLVTNVRYADLAPGAHSVTVKGVQYLRLYPSFSFTFNLTLEI